MLEIQGTQQSDAWLRSRCGRITGSRLADVCAYLSRASKNGKKGDPAGDRIKYRRELIAERLTGLCSDHYYSEYMARGEREEGPSRLFYETLTRRMVMPVSFVVHEEFGFTGASADGLIGSDGVLELKNPNTTTHIAYLEGDVLPEQYVPQCAWELACAGKERRYVDFLSFDSRVRDPKLCYFLKTTGRDELEWTVDDVKLTGENVIDYFTSEVLKLNAEVQQWFAERGVQQVAPFPVEIREEAKEVELSEAEALALAEAAVFSTGDEVMP